MNHIKYIRKSKKFFALFFSTLFFACMLYPIEMKIVVEIVAIMVIQGAAGDVNEMLNEKQAAVFALMQKYVGSVSTDFSEWAKKEQDFFSKEGDGISKIFASQQQDVASRQTDAAAQAQLEVEYITKSISLTQPAQNFVQYPIIFDQRFESGSMYTPDYKTVWYNTTPTGNWMYDPSIKSLLQTMLVDTYTQDAQGNQSAVYAENNCVFTEWYPQTQPYSIHGAVALHKVSYPFFVGLLFNKARWISGNQECIRKYRAVGIFATSAQDAGVYFVEALDDGHGSVQLITDQLLGKKVQPLFAIPESDFALLAQKEVSYEFSITPSAKDISISWKKIDSQDSAQTQKVSSKNSMLYLYHGIGCMSTGAVTEWKFKEPVDIFGGQKQKQSSLSLPVEKSAQQSTALVQK
jgi:hypothetical protein